MRKLRTHARDERAYLQSRQAYLSDHVSSKLWILDLGTWRLMPLQTGLGTLGKALARALDSGGLPGLALGAVTARDAAGQKPAA